jgi:hypothetical protein
VPVTETYAPVLRAGIYGHDIQRRAKYRTTRDAARARAHPRGQEARNQLPDAAGAPGSNRARSTTAELAMEQLEDEGPYTVEKVVPKYGEPVSSWARRTVSMGGSPTCGTENSGTEE